MVFCSGMFFAPTKIFWGTGGGSPRKTPRRRGAVPCRWGATRQQGCTGGSPSGEGAFGPLEESFQGVGVRRGRGKSKSLSTFAPLWLLSRRGESNPGRGAGSPTRLETNNFSSPPARRRANQPYKTTRLPLPSGRKKPGPFGPGFRLPYSCSQLCQTFCTSSCWGPCPQ